MYVSGYEYDSGWIPSLYRYHKIKIFLFFQNWACCVEYEYVWNCAFGELDLRWDVTTLVLHCGGIILVLKIESFVCNAELFPG